MWCSFPVGAGEEWINKSELCLKCRPERYAEKFLQRSQKTVADKHLPAGSMLPDEGKSPELNQSAQRIHTHTRAQGTVQHSTAARSAPQRNSLQPPKKKKCKTTILVKIPAKPNGQPSRRSILFAQTTSYLTLHISVERMVGYVRQTTKGPYPARGVVGVMTATATPRAAFR